MREVRRGLPAAPFWLSERIETTAIVNGMVKMR